MNAIFKLKGGAVIFAPESAIEGTALLGDNALSRPEDAY